MRRQRDLANWRILGITLVVGVALSGACVIAFGDALARFRIDPRVPYATYSPPPAPEYSARGAWALWPDVGDGPGVADVFYVHSTTYFDRRHWNAPIHDSSADRLLLTLAAPNEAGPFSGVGRVYAPRYRQATGFAAFTHKREGLASHELAFRDVERAFDAFIADRDPRRPVVLVGYGQGGIHIAGLLQRRFADAQSPLRKTLAAAYVLGSPLPAAAPARIGLPVCETPDAIRCIAAFAPLDAQSGEAMSALRLRALDWSPNGSLVSVRQPELVCVNPLSWSMERPVAGPDMHVGAGSAAGLGWKARPPAVSGAVGAACRDGVLAIDRPVQDYLRRRTGFGREWRPSPFNLFYFDLAENVQIRVAALMAKLDEEASILEPLDASIEIVDSPINRVPAPN